MSYKIEINVWKTVRTPRTWQSKRPSPPSSIVPAHNKLWAQQNARAILMALGVWAGFFKLEWCRNHSKIWSGGWFLNILGAYNLRENFFACNHLFITNYSKRLRWPPIDLRHRVHLKHQNLISKFSKFREKNMSGSRLFYSVFTGLNFDGKYASGVC